MPLDGPAVDIEETLADSAYDYPSFYSRKGKRIADFIIAAVVLVGISPLLVLLAVVVKLSSPGPALYLQERVGKKGRIFKVIKFRSMIVDADRRGPGITSAGDRRVTKIGRLLRKLKLDELPQLWNVVKGEMSLVGPRPELPVYVAGYNQRQRAVLAVCPGITDSASIAYRWEEEVLSESAAPERLYQDVILPRKLELNLAYITDMSLAHDLSLIVQTLSALLRPRL